MKNGSGRLLFELILGAMVVGGWCYGAYWRSQVVGDDRAVMELYRRIDRLESLNDQLLERIQGFEDQNGSQ